MNEKLTSAKDKLRRNKTKILGTALVVTTTVVILQRHGIKSLNAFLEEKGLSDEYFTPEED